MSWLIIGDLLGIAVTLVLQRALVQLEASLAAIDSTVAAVVGECQHIVTALDGVPALTETQGLTSAVPGLVGRYVEALKPLL